MGLNGQRPYRSTDMKSVYFENLKGKKIFYYLTEPEPSERKIVIMSHGFRGSSIGPARAFVDFEALLFKKRFSVLRFDQPNSGNSDGDYLNSSFNKWVDTTTHFAKKYLNLGYQVALLGQSMGASTSVIASARPEIKDKTKCLLLWVPDPKSTFKENPDEVYEEGGQKYRGTFWQEAKESDFFKCLNDYEGNVHLVYGENDKFISKELRDKVIEVVKSKGHKVMVLEGQEHSPWEFDIAQKVYSEELELIEASFKH